MRRLWKAIAVVMAARQRMQMMRVRAMGMSVGHLMRGNANWNAVVKEGLVTVSARKRICMPLAQPLHWQARQRREKQTQARGTHADTNRREVGPVEETWDHSRGRRFQRGRESMSGRLK